MWFRAVLFAICCIIKLLCVFCVLVLSAYVWFCYVCGDVCLCADGWLLFWVCLVVILIVDELIEFGLGIVSCS